MNLIRFNRTPSLSQSVHRRGLGNQIPQGSYRALSLFTFESYHLVREENQTWDYLWNRPETWAVRCWFMNMNKIDNEREQKWQNEYITINTYMTENYQWLWAPWLHRHSSSHISDTQQIHITFEISEMNKVNSTQCQTFTVHLKFVFESRLVSLQISYRVDTHSGWIVPRHRTRVDLLRR